MQIAPIKLLSGSHADTGSTGQGCFIPLTKGAAAIVSPEDLVKVSLFRWCVSDSRDRLVAMRSYRINGKTKTVLMHRFIAEAIDGVSVDHIDGNPLNNQRNNLRLVSHAENRLNTKKQSNNTSGFKGVILDKRSGKWMARITKQYKMLHLGLFESAILAAKAYDAAAKNIHGKFAKLNFGD